MRKLLLASATALGGTLAMASLANAQMLTQYPYTPPAGRRRLSAPSSGTDIQTWTSNPPVSPGSYTVRLAGRLSVYFGVGTDSTRSGGGVTTEAALTADDAEHQAGSLYDLRDCPAVSEL